MGNEMKAVVIATGKKVRVMRSKLQENWIDLKDCVTRYSADELSFDA